MTVAELAEILDCTYPDNPYDTEAVRQAAARLRVLEAALKDVLAEEMIYTGAIHETLEASGMHVDLTAKILAALERTSVTPVSNEQSK